MTNPRILFLDIETAPALVYTFSLFKPIIGIDQIVEPSRIICWSAKWYGQNKVMFDSEHKSGRTAMLEGIHALMDEADIIVGYNSNSFDIPWLEGEFVGEGMGRPSPSSYVDLYRVSKKHMKLISGKLDYLSLTLLGERKVTHEGFTLWKKCIGPDGEDKDKAWRVMEKYAKRDTALLEPLYDVLRPYISGINVALLTGEEFACPTCGSTHLQKRGFKATGAGVFQQYECQSCGAWPRDSKRVATTQLRNQS